MIITYKKGNHLYLVFQDFQDNEKDIYKELNYFSKNSQKIIKKFLLDNFFSNTLERQTSYINTISTYINDMFDDENQYFFHLYILPKDLEITNSEEYKDYELIQKIESLSIKLFKLYSAELDFNEKSIKLFKNYEGDNFLQLEAYFYINHLEKIYSYLINYKSNHQMKIVCSDKKIGIEIDDLNLLESNPLKNYQFIKIAYQKNLICFVYSLIDFLKIYRIQIFNNEYKKEYSVLLKLIDKINNLLLKISSRKYLINDNIKKENLKKYFIKYKNTEELKQNKKLYKVIKSIFYTQLENNMQFFVSIDLTKVFEKIVEKKLSSYNDNLYIGDETNKKIVSKNKYNVLALNNINFLLNEVEKPKQYPDFLIKDTFDNTEIYHILDAKYKLLANKKYNANDIRQVLIYALLFNKEYSKDLINQKDIKKIIIFVKQTKIDLKYIDNVIIDSNKIYISSDSDCDKYVENLFDSEIKYIGVNTIRIK